MTEGLAAGQTVMSKSPQKNTKQPSLAQSTVKAHFFLTYSHVKSHMQMPFITNVITLFRRFWYFLLSFTSSSECEKSPSSADCAQTQVLHTHQADLHVLNPARTQTALSYFRPLMVTLTGPAALNKR